MATPLRPLQSKRDLVADILKQHPGLMREELIELADALVHGTALAWQLARPTGWRIHGRMAAIKPGR
jgi:hypothetical protein